MSLNINNKPGLLRDMTCHDDYGDDAMMIMVMHIIIKT
jgi:hypothetical protein